MASECSKQSNEVIATINSCTQINHADIGIINGICMILDFHFDVKKILFHFFLADNSELVMIQNVMTNIRILTTSNSKVSTEYSHIRMNSICVHFFSPGLL